MAKVHGKMTRSEQMAAIRSSNTEIEVMLRKELWGRGLRYRKNVKKIFGKPDIAFIGLKIAIFCDSEFWHGKDFQQGKVPKTNKEYLDAKIAEKHKPRQASKFNFRGRGLDGSSFLGKGY